ncbi:MoxR family ATPase [Actinoplanes sp. LDG1-06]|uniref:MoxR family ATPase n=1 Tax=Paractinoplanes ovalisporus TaxID=2810368 RepID=A0ABS2A912_9ACTN|nr:MoxR family ATPase [Actinoplanes ovalisporus]MBM2616250.1 MoxR family ATPase [Actinoplanes ovalisporus]
MSEWHVFSGSGEQREWVLPEPPPWRRFTGGPLVEPPGADWWEHRPADLERALAYQPTAREVELVNVAIYLRRPLLITGRPGTGKSTLAYAIAHELGLGPVLRWPITSRSSLQEALYRYDAIGRLQDVNLSGEPTVSADGIGRYLQLGPLGTALLPYGKPRVLLVDEIDKSDIDLPNDLLNVFEEGEFTIPELARHSTPEVTVRIDPKGTARVTGGTVRCRAFPIVILTSNGERDFPPAFLRRCVRLELGQPDSDRLAKIVEAHLGPDLRASASDVIDAFLARRDGGELATDQLLNAVFLTQFTPDASRRELVEVVLRHLSDEG